MLNARTDILPGNVLIALPACVMYKQICVIDGVDGNIILASAHSEFSFVVETLNFPYGTIIKPK